MGERRYYLLAVSRWDYLQTCINYGWAGFTNSTRGFWAYVDIEVGDYVSFLYGARIINLYEVVEKVAYRNAENLPPWPVIRFKDSRKTYYFPFRLKLRKLREVNEPMIRPEFFYVAENLLLRGGYWKTHFQSDRLSLNIVSQRGRPEVAPPSDENFSAERFTPLITFKKDRANPPYVYPFTEVILQAMIKRRLNDVLGDVLKSLGSGRKPEEYEVLSEKALMEGYVDIFVKLKDPVGSVEAVPFEVKRGNLTGRDLEQVLHYVERLSGDAIGGGLVGSGLGKRFPKIHGGVAVVLYEFRDLDKRRDHTYGEMLEVLSLTVIS